MNSVIAWLDGNHVVFWPLFIFCARICDVSIGTIRTICVVRGYRLIAAVLGFFEVIIWVTAVSGVFRHLDAWYNIVAYGAGFASGNAIGIWLEQKLALGMQAILLISSSHSAAVAEALRFAGYPVTEFKGHGREGIVSMTYVVTHRKDSNTAICVAQRIDPNVFIAISDVCRTDDVTVYRSTPPPAGWRDVIKRK